MTRGKPFIKVWSNYLNVIQPKIYLPFYERLGKTIAFTISLNFKVFDSIWTYKHSQGNNKPILY